VNLKRLLRDWFELNLSGFFIWETQQTCLRQIPQCNLSSTQRIIARARRFDLMHSSVASGKRTRSIHLHTTEMPMAKYQPRGGFDYRSQPVPRILQLLPHLLVHITGDSKPENFLLELCWRQHCATRCLLGLSRSVLFGVGSESCAGGTALTHSWLLSLFRGSSHLEPPYPPPPNSRGSAPGAAQTTATGPGAHPGKEP
jgi:hypothetical protein